MISISSIVFYQNQFILTRPIGYAKENVVEIHLNGLPENFNPQVLKEELIRFPEVISATVCNGSPLTGRWTRGVQLNGSTVELSSFSGDIDFINTLDLTILKGRVFSMNLPSDTAALLVNETAARLFSLDENFEPDDHQLKLSGRVIGIVKDFHFSSLKEKITPAVVGYHSFKRIGFEGSNLMIRLTDKNDFLKNAEQIWKKLLPYSPFEYSLLDQKYLALYSEDFNQSDLLLVGTVVSIAINLFGLLGLALFTAQRRSKEVAIRKVLGATSKNILIMFLLQIIKAALISSIIATPIALYFSDLWLENFVYKVEPSWIIFALSIFVIVLIALISVFYQAYRSSTRNPAETLKYQ